MCRLFGFRSSTPLCPTADLITASNAIATQSRKHPDGWGLASFSGSAPMLVRSTRPAHADPLFRSESARLSACAAVVHVRKASVGGLLVRNTHPFVHEGWAFAHNGTVQLFDRRRATMEKSLDRDLRRALRGDTDSERCFLLFLTFLRRARATDSLERAQVALSGLARWVASTDPADVPKPSSVNVVCSDGDRFLALRFNKDLAFSTGSRRERARRTGERVTSLVVSSEPAGTPRRWRSLRNSTGVAVDSRFVLRRFRVE